MTPRLPESPTQRISRENELLFFYRGKPFKGLEGDTIATALYSNGVRIFSRSMKYHRPRGLYNLDGYSSHCLVTVDGEPNVRGCATPLRQGMWVTPQNVLGSPRWDLMGLMQFFSFAMPVGFYYKAFHKPSWVWPFAQAVIRRAAGLGRIDPEMPEGVYQNRYYNCEVCIIGGGLAGMEAALAAAEGGVRVILLERRDHLGGDLAYRVTRSNEGIPPYRRAAMLAEAVSACENVTVLLCTSATAIYQSNHVTAVKKGGAGDPYRETYLEVRARSVVVATGAIERPLLFSNNDLPGIMQGSCAHRLARVYAIKPGNRMVVSGCHDGMLEMAADLAELGIEIVAVADGRSSGFDTDLISNLHRKGIPFLPGTLAQKAIGFKTLKGVQLAPTFGNGRKLRYSCDVLAASAGEAPLSQLLQVAGAKMAYDSAAGQFLPREYPPGIHAAGKVTAARGEETIAAQGKLAGLMALQDLGLDRTSHIRQVREILDVIEKRPAGRHWTAPPVGSRKCFLCFDEDVTTDQVRDAIDQGFDQSELVKRYTAVGTGPSQSYLSGTNLPLLLADQRGLEPGAVLPTTVRPPVFPTSLAALGGRRYTSSKRTPLHEKQAQLGACFRLTGVWERAGSFADAGLSQEVENVRKNVGFIDVSTLGKFRLFGRDAVKLLNRVYAGNMETVTEGRLKYAAMCNEQGVIIDDGVVTRMGESDYFFTTSSLRAGNTLEWLAFHSKEEDWEAHLVNLTDAMAAVNLAGPRSREVLAKLVDADCSNEVFPYMAVRRMKLCGEVDALVMRVGFVGELSFEIHVPASYGAALQDALLDAGKPYCIRPFGLDAQSVLRLEKGHVIIGTDTDNHSTLHDIGLSWAWDRKKAGNQTVGAPALRFTETQKHRQKLVGFTMNEAFRTPSDGSIVVADGTVKGRVTSSRFSPTLGRSIGLALVDPDLAVMGGTLEFYTDGRLNRKGLPEIKTFRGTIVPVPFYDPEGKRLRG